MSATWWLVVGTVVGCFLLKLAGYLIPPRLLERPGTRRLLELVPVALLAALVVVQLFADGRGFAVDGPRTAGVAVAAVALWRRAPFLVVIVLAGVTAAGVRLLL